MLGYGFQKYLQYKLNFAIWIVPQVRLVLYRSSWVLWTGTGPAGHQALLHDTPGMRTELKGEYLIISQFRDEWRCCRRLRLNVGHIEQSHGTSSGNIQQPPEDRIVSNWSEIDCVQNYLSSSVAYVLLSTIQRMFNSQEQMQCIQAMRRPTYLLCHWI